MRRGERGADGGVTVQKWGAGEGGKGTREKNEERQKKKEKKEEETNLRSLPVSYNPSS